MREPPARRRAIFTSLPTCSRIRFSTAAATTSTPRVPITVTEAALGAKIEVPTIDGRSLLRVPPGTNSGQKLRLREKGVPSVRNPGHRGDQYVELQVVVPKPVDERVRELLKELEKLAPEDPRKDFSTAPRRKDVRSAAMTREQSLKRKKARAGYMISAVAELYKLHPQTLRLYERVGLAEAFALARQHAALHGLRPGTPRSDPDADARNGRQPRGNRNHSEHARENGAKCSTRWKRSLPSCSRNWPAGSARQPRDRTDNALVRVPPPKVIRVHKDVNPQINTVDA